MMNSSHDGYDMDAGLRYVQSGKIKVSVGTDGAVIWKSIKSVW
jgi:hypothetical protein